LKWYPVKLKLSDLKPFDRNPRTITDSKFESLKKSLDDLGEFKPLVVDFDKQTILAGNQRFRAMLEKYNLDHEVDCFVPDRELTEAEREKVVVVENGHFGEWNYDLLSGFSIDLGELDLDISIPDIELPEVEQIEGQCDDDEIPEVKHSISRRGDLWVLGKHKCLCGDSTMIDDVERLMGGDKADMVFTDPPFPNNSGIMHDMIENINIAFSNSRSVCSGMSIWFWDNICFPEFNEMITSKHIWHKTNGWQAGHFETMYVFHNDKKRHEQFVFSENSVGGENIRLEQGNHPTPKPVKLPIAIFEKLDFKNSVLDLFLGSGSTLIACEKTNRKCYGMELDEHYVDVIIERYLKFTGRDDVYLESTGEKYLDLKEKRDAK
jgi:DNA modification methylase